jgi:hypothetical protein
MCIDGYEKASFMRMSLNPLRSIRNATSALLEVASGNEGEVVSQVLSIVRSPMEAFANIVDVTLDSAQ